MLTGTHDPTATLSQLTIDIADIIKGYEVMEERADADLRPVAQRFHALHEAHAAALWQALEKMGARPREPGSMMGAVHQAVATGRDWVGALDASAIAQIVSGEERLLSSYDDALDTAEPQPELQELLLHQRATLKSQIDALKRD